MELSNVLRLSLIQSNLHWEDIDANLSMFEAKIHSINKTDIILLPEMFTTGFTNNSSNLAEEMGGKTCQWMTKLAKEKSAVIAGSIIIKENQKYYNRFLWVQADGTIEYYNKKHLFAMAKEDEFYTAGNKKKIIDFKGWKICLQVCYDLRFPVWSRRTQDPGQNYDLLIYVASWPKARIQAWSTLLKARAIENLSYCIGLNRVGTDGSGFEYTGASVLVDPLGTNLAGSHPGKDEIISCEINYSDLMTIRKKLPFDKDQDAFVLS